MNDVIYDTSKHIESLIPVTQVSSVAVVCTTDQFLKAGENWESLVCTENWEDANTVLDTVLFADGLEKTMGNVQLEKTSACNWDILKLISKNDNKICRYLYFKKQILTPNSHHRKELSVNASWI